MGLLSGPVAPRGEGPADSRPAGWGKSPRSTHSHACPWLRCARAIARMGYAAESIMIEPNFVLQKSREAS